MGKDGVCGSDGIMFIFLFGMCVLAISVIWVVMLSVKALILSCLGLSS